MAKKLGSGMTAREIETSRESVLEALDAAQTGPVARLERWALDTLAAVGIESPRSETSSGWRAVAEELGFIHDEPEWYAARFLECIRYIRAARERGDWDQFGEWSYELGGVRKEAQMKLDFEPSWLRGQKFIKGPQHERTDRLAGAIDRALVALGEPTKKVTSDNLLAYVENDPVVDCVMWEDEVVRWERSDGTIKETSFKSFRNRVSGRRKKMSS